MSIKSDRWIKEQCIHPTRRMKFAQDRDYGTTDENEIGKPYEPFVQHMHHREWEPMITPFAHEQVREDVNWNRLISYGNSSFGYDVRAADEWEIFTNINSAVVDPKAFDDNCLKTVKAPSILIPPNSFALARTVEYFRIPRDVLVVCLGKSTYARCGIIVNVTPLEPEWEGHVTLEFSNTTNLPARIYANEGVAQMLFFQSDEECEVSYKDRGGKYQGQTGVTRPKA